MSFSYQLIMNNFCLFQAERNNQYKRLSSGDTEKDRSVEHGKRNEIDEIVKQNEAQSLKLKTV